MNEFIKVWGEVMVVEVVGFGIVVGLGRFGLWGVKGVIFVVIVEG